MSSFTPVTWLLRAETQGRLHLQRQLQKLRCPEQQIL